MKTKSRTPPKKAAPALRRKRAAVAASAIDRTNVRTVREGLGLTQNSFARLTGYSVRTIAQWEAGKPPSDAKHQRLVEVERLQQALRSIIRPSFVGPWLETPNDAFGGLKPLEVIERGEVDRIWRMIYELEAGIPT
jgi:DNA-binding transcriptional regulator YiaG